MDFAGLSIDRETGFHLIRTAVVIGVAYLIGHLINAFVIGRLLRFVNRTGGSWDNIVIEEIRRRIPFLSLLAGVSISLERWQLAPSTLAIWTSSLRALAILSLTLALSAVTTRLVATYGNRGEPGVPVAALTQNIVRFVIIALGLLVIAREFGFEVTPYLAALGVGGLAVALALQDPLSNLFGGVFMSISGQVQIGDYIRVDPNVEGYVIDFDWRTTRIRMLANNVVTVPNAKLAQAVVTNFSAPSTELNFNVEIPVDFDNDLALVERVASEVGAEVMREVKGGVSQADVTVRFNAFGPSGVTVAVGLKGQTFTDQFLLKHEFIKRVHGRFVSEGITLGVPQTGVTTRTLQGPRDASAGEDRRS